MSGKAGLSNGTTQKKAKRRSVKKRAARPSRPKVKTRKGLSTTASKAVLAAADALWDKGETPHELLRELHEVLLLRCLAEADGNYAGAAKLFGPSRQSIQQFANSSLRDERWKVYQNNKRRPNSSPRLKATGS